MNEAMVLSCMSSYEPCAVTDNDGNIFFNPPMKALMDLPKDMRLPFEVFQQQEKLSRENRIFVTAFNQQPFGRNAITQPWLFYYFPTFDGDAEGKCNGTFCHAHPCRFISTQECVDGEAPRPATFEPDTRFTPSEREVIFFAVNGLSAKEIGQRQKISYRTVENKLQVIFNKIGAHSARELAMYCRENGTDRYIPPSLLSLSSHVLSQGGVA
ncbi:helix-turn-helix transcriptional regulator [Sodalis sp. TME1]|nr:helix-turn-helix transcriptional regulator [Sodalis sp. TME1]